MSFAARKFQIHEDIIGQNGNDGLHYESTTIDFTKDSEYIRLYGETKTDNTES